MDLHECRVHGCVCVLVSVRAPLSKLPGQAAAVKSLAEQLLHPDPTIPHLRTKNSLCPALSWRAGGRRAAPPGTQARRLAASSLLGPPFSSPGPPQAPMSSCRPCLAQGREEAGRCRGPAPGWAAGLQQVLIRSSMAWGPPPHSGQGQLDGHESARGASGSLDLTTGWRQGRPGGRLSSSSRAGTGQEESPAGVGQALTSFSILTNTASASTQKAPLGGP